MSIAEQTVNSTLFGPNVNAITIDTTWTNDNIYILTDKVFVGIPAAAPLSPSSPAPRSIRPSTTWARPDKDDDQFGALVITRGAKIEAAGTADEPIVFTTTDELEAETLDSTGTATVRSRSHPPYSTYGRWGGVVVLGNAPITVGGVNDGATENRIEGFQPASSADLDTDSRADVIEYGGNDATDDSGTLQLRDHPPRRLRL